MKPQKIVVIGGGQAAFSFLELIRKEVPNVALVLIGEESSLPYQRPPLSKKYLLGEMALERLLFRPLGWYQDQDIECRLETRVTEINRARKQITTDSGDLIDYDKLMIATGSRPRPLPADNGQIENLYYLRSTADADRLRGAIAKDQRIAIVGGGYIGLEVAAVAARNGADVTLFEQSERILGRVASRETADMLRALHQKHRVTIVEGVRASLVVNEQRITAINAEGTPTCPVDSVLVGIGALPNDELARTAGLETANGIVVDASARTSDPDIYAAGDCTCFEFHGEMTRLESVQNAIEQAKVAAQHIAGRSLSYQPVPWFWSDQYDRKLQIVGLNRGFDRTEVRQAERGDGQSVSYFKGAELIAVDALNDPRAYLTAKRHLEAKRDAAKAAAPVAENRTMPRHHRTSE